MNRLSHALLLALGLASSVPVSLAATGSQPVAPVALSIAAQPLEIALQNFAKQSGLQVIFATELTRDLVAPAVQGSYTPEAALQLLLRDSRLQFEFVNERTVRISDNAAGLVLAQGDNQNSQIELEEIVVTGTHIRDTVVAGSAVQTISADEIAKSGKGTVAELLRALPANFVGGVANGDNARSNSDTTSVGSNLSGGSGLNLRGLGAQSTLVLIDGRRVASSGQYGNFVDIANIPAAAIERIEILPDGASAVYGSDAIGGVVNFIMKRDLTGLQTMVRLGTTTEGGGDELLASAVWGNRWDGGRMVFGYEYHESGRLKAEDRDFTADFSGQGGINWPRYTTRIGPSANIYPGLPGNTGSVLYTAPPGPGIGLTVDQLTPVVGGVGNTFNPWAGWDISPHMARHSLFFTASQEIGDRATIYGGARYTRRDGVYRTGYAGVAGVLPNTNPYYIPGIANNFNVLIDDVLTTRDVAVNSLGADAGIRFDLGSDWELDFTVSHSREEQTRKSMLMRDANIADRILIGSVSSNAPNSTNCALSGLTSANIGAIANPTPAQQFCAALNYTPFNPYSSEPVPAAVLSQLIGYENLQFNSWVTQGTLKADGTLFELPGGPVKAALGFDHRKEYIDGLLNFNYRSIRPISQRYGATERKVNAAYAELAVPLVGSGNAVTGVKALDLSLAVRYEDSSGLGDFSTTNPKFGVRYKPIDSLTLRGTYGTSFHAPPMRYAYNGPQPVPGGNAIFIEPNTWTAPCNTTLVSLNGNSGTPGSPVGNCSFTAMVVSGGAGPTLKPEKADTWTAGVEFAPQSVPGLNLSASYFNLKVEDRLVRFVGGAMNAAIASYFATGTSPYLANLHFRPDLAEVEGLFADPRFIGHTGAGQPATPADIAAVFYATQTNLAALKMDGVDLAAKYSFDTGLGTFALFASGTLVLSYDIQSTRGAAFVDKLGVYENTGNPVKLKSRQGIAFTRGPFNASAALNYTDDYVCKTGCYVPNTSGAPVLNTSPIKIDSWVTLDLQFGYNFEQHEGLLANAGVSLSVNNALDEDAPFVDTGRVLATNAPEPYDPSNANVIGRTVALMLTKHF